MKTQLIPPHVRRGGEYIDGRGRRISVTNVWASQEYVDIYWTDDTVFPMSIRSTVPASFDFSDWSEAAQ